jgi:hypothetical protein
METHRHLHREELHYHKAYDVHDRARGNDADRFIERRIFPKTCIELEYREDHYADHGIERSEFNCVLNKGRAVGEKFCKIELVAEEKRKENGKIQRDCIGDNEENDPRQFRRVDPSCTG